MRLEQGDTEGTRLTKVSTRGNLSNYKNYISDWFPNIYVDEVSGSILEKFVKRYTKLNSIVFLVDLFGLKLKMLFIKHIILVYMRL